MMVPEWWISPVNSNSSRWFYYVLLGAPAPSISGYTTIVAWRLMEFLGGWTVHHGSPPIGACLWEKMVDHYSGWCKMTPSHGWDGLWHWVYHYIYIIIYTIYYIMFYSAQPRSLSASTSSVSQQSCMGKLGEPKYIKEMPLPNRAGT